MSSFNKPYRNTDEMIVDAKEARRKTRVKTHRMKNTTADQIFRAVLDEIKGGKKDFSKTEMVGLVNSTKSATTRGSTQWYAWDMACTEAIRKIRSYFWSDVEDVVDRQMFHYVRPEKRYHLIAVDDTGRTNIVYEAYDAKMKGIAKKQRQIAKSAYNQVLELDTSERKKLIKELKSEGYFENGLLEDGSTA